MKYYRILLILLFFLLLSCSSDKIELEKYREKNLIDILRINSSIGDIEVNGWQYNFIEIQTIKELNSGLKQDLKQLEIFFIREKNEFTIATKRPARINGSTNLKLFVPYTLMKIYINSGSGNIDINKYLGDIEIYHNKGKMKINFSGQYLRITSKESDIKLNIDTGSSSDVVISNENGNTNCELIQSGNISYFDFFSNIGTINLKVNKSIPCIFYLFDENNSINTNLNIEKNFFSQEGLTFITGKTIQTDDSSDLNVMDQTKIFVINKHGVISLVKKQF